MEVASRHDCIVEDQRVVGGAIQFDFEDSASVCQRVPYRAVDLRDAAQTVGILNAAAIAVGSGNLAPVQEIGEVARAQYLSRMWTSCMQARIARRRGSAKRLYAQSCRRLRGVEEIFQLLQPQTSNREHGLSSIEE